MVLLEVDAWERGRRDGGSRHLEGSGRSIGSREGIARSIIVVRPAHSGSRGVAETIVEGNRGTREDDDGIRLVGDGNGSIYGIAYVSSSIDFTVLYLVGSDEGGIDRSTCLEGSGRVIRSREGIARSIDIVCP